MKCEHAHPSISEQQQPSAQVFPTGFAMFRYSLFAEFSMELLQAVVMEQLYLPLPSYNTIQTAGFLWLLTFNSLGTHLEMSNCRQIVFECLRSCLPCCPLQSKCMGFRVRNQMAVNELQIWWEHCVAMRSFQPFPTPSSKFVTLLTLIAFNCNCLKSVSVGSFTIYILQSTQTRV